MSRLSIVLSASLLACAVLLTAPAQDAEKPDLDREEAKKAFEYLNRVRARPAEFSKEIKADLSDVKARPALKWNDILAKVAEEKAADMAKRDYFSHTTPEGLGINRLIHDAGYKLPAYMLKDKSATFFESIAAGRSTGKGIIDMLVRDENTPGLGHRKHLLGIDDFWAGCTDCGIGIARNPRSKFRVYSSVIIARQK
jgi:uncharacterized protein YkwD